VSMLLSVNDAVQFSAAARQKLTAGRQEAFKERSLHVCEVHISAAVSVLRPCVSSLRNCVQDDSVLEKLELKKKRS